MTLRNKVALTFSGITSLILLVIFSYIYLHTLHYEQKQFYNRLKIRAESTARTYLKENTSANTFNRAVNQHNNGIPGEREYILPVAYKDTAILPDFVNNALVEKVLAKKNGYAENAGNPVVVGYLYQFGNHHFMVFVAAPDVFEQKNLSDLFHTLLVILVIYLVSVFLIGRWYAGQVLEPLESMVGQVESMDTITLNKRVKVPDTEDEISKLGNSFNDLLDRIDIAQKTQQNFIGNASHELKNPLTAILGEIDVTLQKERTPGQYQKSLQIINSEARRLRQLTLKLLQLAQAGYNDISTSLEKVRIDELLYDILKEYKDTYPGRQFQLQLDELPENENALSLEINMSLFKIALANLLDNALKFSDGTIRIGLSADDRSVTIDITDFGIGIPEEDQRSLFIPFFRSENARIVPGFGIGLPLVKRIADMHHAELKVESKEGGPTTFSLILPLF